MSLPELTIPALVPYFKADGVSRTRDEVFANVAMRTGHRRKRRVYTATQEVMTVRAHLDQDQMTALDAWAEDACKGYSERFAARLVDHDGSIAWWDAEWVEPYKADPKEGGRWEIEGSLLLHGDPSASAPVVTGAQMEVGISLVATASIPLDGSVSMEVGMALQLSAFVSMEVGMTLVAAA